MTYCRTCWATLPADSHDTYCCDQCARRDRRTTDYLRRIPTDRPERVRAYLQRVEA